ncbi:MAG TPA: hypothetical protein VMF55_09640 [Solirubrobacterales bacterium]|nr:hypothetical protein [Solirubrobacterales bacterium]
MTLDRLRWTTRQRLGARDLTHPILRALARQDSSWFVGRETDVCIEGYPRSGNSFAVESFRQANPAARIAHHVHVPSQITRALSLRIPAALVIRDPADAVTSFAIYWGGRIPIGILLGNYIDFHRALEDKLDEIAICPFELFADRPAYVAKAVDRRFGTTYAAKAGSMLSEGEGESRARILSAIESSHVQRFGGDAVRSPAPTDAKRELKTAVLAELECQPRLEAARTLHKSFLTAVQVPG